MLSDEFVKEIRGSVSLSDIINRKVKLVKKGKNFLGLCPFHNEKTPSFNVNDEEGYYHCFGCGAHGDSISFVRNFENKSFIEAIRTISEISGIKIPTNNAENIEVSNERKALSKIIDLTTKFYCEKLFSSNGKDALSYVKSRGLNDLTIKSFKIGYAPQIGLKEYLKHQGFNEEIMIKAGLLRVDKNNNLNEIFRNRLIFPILDKKNFPIAFGARAMFASKAKYLNSPNSLLFQKSETLYGISHLNKDKFYSKPLLIVEGYMDVISIFQSKIANALAPLGTAISENQVQTIWNLNIKPLVCLDGDKAGETAAWRLINKILPILKIGREISFVWLPKNKDPDDMLRNSNNVEFLNIINDPMSLIDTIWAILKNKYDIEKPDTKAQLWAEAKKTVSLIKDTNLRQTYSDEVFKKIKNSRESNYNYIKTSYARPSTGKKSLLNSIFIILMYHPQLALDFSEYIVRLDFKNNFKNKIVLILIDMIIKHPNIDIIEFNNHLSTVDLGHIIKNIDIEIVKKRIGYDPSKTKTKHVRDNFSELINKVLDEDKRI